MASSGSFQNTFRTGYTLRVEWKINSQSIADNTSSVTVTAFLVSSGSSYTINSSASKTVKLTINGTTYSKSASGLASLSGGQKKSLFAKTVTISHSSDGSKSIGISCALDLEVTLSGTYWGTIKAPASGSATATLDTIPRATTPTTSGTFAVGNTVTINTPRASSAFTHTLQYSTNNSTFYSIKTGVGTSTTWELPTALVTARPSATSGTVYIRCITYNGSSQIGTKTISRTYTIPSSEAAPHVSIAASQVNDANISQYIRGRSKVTLKASATVRYSATVKKYVFKYGSTEKTVTTTATSASVTFTLPSNAASSYAYSVTLTDSRGFTASASGTQTTVAYTAPTISGLNIVRGNYNGTTFTENSKGNSLRITANCTVSSLSSTNAKNYKIEYRLSNATTYTTLINTTAAASYAASIIRYTDAIFSENASYVIRFTLSDSFESVSQIVDVPSQKVLMNFSANGKAMAIGGIASIDDALEIMLEAYATGGIKPITLADGTNLDEIVKTGLYVGSMNTQTMVNSPMTSGSFTLEVSGAGTDGQLMQRYSYCNKTTYRAFVRFYYQSAWGEWQPAEGFTSFTYADYEGRVRLANGILIQWGRISIVPTAANVVTEQNITFPVAYSKIPNFQVEARSTVPQNITYSGTATVDGASIFLTRNNTSSTSLVWLAVGVSA